jgi:multidrug efflux pump
VLTLYTTPVVYVYLDRFSLWLRRSRAGRQSPSLTPQRLPT